MDRKVSEAPPARGWRKAFYVVIYEADTPLGRAFDVGLIAAILISIVAVALESVPGIRAAYGSSLRGVEWAITILFTLEYALRLFAAPRPLVYAKSFFGIVDLLAVLPTYLSLLVPGGQALVVVRVIRVLRIFRVLRLSEYLSEAGELATALRASRRKIIVFLSVVGTIVVVMGSLMYLIEGESSGFNSIPHGMYWAIVTMTTVGYGDLAPRSPLGQALASVLMVMGYAIIAVPTGIVTAALSQPTPVGVTSRTCRACMGEGHDAHARHCKHCGHELGTEPAPSMRTS